MKSSLPTPFNENSQYVSVHEMHSQNGGKQTYSTKWRNIYICHVCYSSGIKFLT